MTKYGGRGGTLLGLSLTLSSALGCDNVLGIDAAPTVMADAGADSALSGASRDARPAIDDATRDVVDEGPGSPGPVGADSTVDGADARVPDGDMDTPRDGTPDGSEQSDGPIDAEAGALSDGLTEAEAAANLDSGPEGGDGAPLNCALQAPSSRVVLFGGDDQGPVMLDDTWEWNGTRWTPRAPQNRPPGRWSASGAPLCGRALVFGGSTSNGTPYCDDQWSWDGTNWTPTGTTPFAISFTSAAALSGTIVQFGGQANALSTPDTWVWNAASWLMPPLNPLKVPLGRQFPMIAALGSDIVLFGGLSDTSKVFADTWIWNGSTWIERTTAHSPPPTFGAVGVALRNTLMMFSGLDVNSNAVPDTWLWDGSDWSKAQVTNPPPARSQASAAALGQDVILFGGQDTNGNPLGDTWQWDGTNWTQLQVPGPPARYGSIMVAF